MKQIWLIAMVIMTVSLQAGWFSPEKKPAVRQSPPMDIVYEKSEALSLINEIRETMGLNTFSQNNQLSKAAQAHAEYLVLNHSDSHYEVAGLPGFTGVKPEDRAWHAGYLSSQVSENLSTQSRSAKESIDGLFSAIYHRFGFLDLSMDEVGVGVAQEKNKTRNTAFVYLMGNTELNALCYEKSFSGYGRYVYGVCKDTQHRISQKKFEKAKNSSKWINPKVVVYPYDGQADVPPAFYNEHPDPLPDYEVSGFPVSVTFNDYFFHKVILYSFELPEASGKKVSPVRLLDHSNDPNGRFSPYEFALFPLKRLHYDTEYHARIVYGYKGKKFEKRWSFHTRIPPEHLVRITQKEETVTLEKGQSYWLYFVPADGHDAIKDIIFPEDVNLYFIDNNTLRIHVPCTGGSGFTLRSKRHVVHIRYP